jgi:hypothetical protein
MLSHNEAQIEICNSAGRNHIVGASTHIGGSHAIDIEGGKIQQFEQLLAATLNVAEPKFLTQCIVVDRLQRSPVSLADQSTSRK